MPQVIPIIAAAAASAAGSAIGAAIGSAIGGAILGVSAAAIGSVIGGILLSAAVSIGLSMLMAPSNKAAKGSRERTQSSRESAMARTLAAGTVRVGANCHPIYDTNSENRLLRLIICASNEIASFERHYLIGEEVTLDGSNLVTGSTDGKWDGKVLIEPFLGSATQAALAQVVTDYVPWSTSHRAQGMAGVYIRQSPVGASDKRARHLHGVIGYEALIKGALIYDPRDGTTGWTDNAALVALWYLTNEHGRGHSIDRYDLDSWKIAADICDEAVPLSAGGTEKRYRCNAVIGWDEEQNGVVERLLANFDAVTYFTPSGKIAVQVGDEAPSNYTTLAESHILATNFQAGPRAIDRFNRVVPLLISEAHDYQEITAPAAEDAASIAADGAKTFAFSLPYCPSHTQAQRLAKKRLLRLNPEEIGTVTTNLAGLNIRPGQSIRLAYDTAETDLDLRVGNRRVGADGSSVELEVYSVSPAYDEWSIADERDLLALPAVNATGALVGIPENVAAASFPVALNLETPGAGISIEWDDPSDDTIQAEVQFAVANSGQWFGAQLIEDASQGVAYSGILEDGAAYDARVRFIGAGGSPTGWVMIEDVTAQAVVSTIAGPDLTGVFDGGASSVAVSGVAPDAASLFSVVVYYGTTTTFGDATEFADKSVLRGDAFTVTKTGLTAPFDAYFWATAKNVSGVEGSPGAMLTVSEV